MGGSMARKESRAPNGHPAELKKEGETAVQQVAARRSLLLWGIRLPAGTSRFSAKSLKDMQAKQCSLKNRLQ